VGEGMVVGRGAHPLTRLPANTSLGALKEVRGLTS
jgi:hypothetical protein